MARGFFSSGDSDSDDDYSHGDDHRYEDEEEDEEEELATDTAERLTRRLYKKHLKERYNLRKHETKIQQAVFRRDAAVEAVARAGWKSYLQRLRNDPNSFLNHKHKEESSSAVEDVVSSAGTTANPNRSSTPVQLNQKPEFGLTYTAARSMEERETPRVRHGRLRLLKIRESLVKGILAATAERPPETPAAAAASEDIAAARSGPSADAAPSPVFDIRTTTKDELQELVVSWGYAEFRGDQIDAWIREKGVVDPSDMNNLPRALRERLLVQFCAANASAPGSALTAKEAQTLHARELKAHMHAGTQTKDMFEDRLALLGYTRQKFHERAVLAMASLDKLDPGYKKEAPSSSKEDGGNDNDNDNAELHRHIWERLLRTQQVVSIGCGPGCDAVGALGFLTDDSLPSDIAERRRLRNGVLLMDFAIDSWKDPVLDTLVPLVVPGLVPVAETLPCNIRKALVVANSKTTTSNEAAFRALTETHKSDRRLVVISYLLTETRHAWKVFLGDLLVLLKGTESLLLLTEPTAWQLQEFLRCFGGGGRRPTAAATTTTTGGNHHHENDGDTDTNDDDTDDDDDNDLLIKAHVWLDSSRDLPHLQVLDSRNGPAILLVCTM